MNGVREFRREDIGPVAALWLRIFRRCTDPPGKALQDYFRQIFFQSPWADPGLPSLVYEEEGRIAGFLGVVPRPMTFRGRPIRAAVATQLMVDDEALCYPGPKLVRRFLAGAQDLSYSDGANEKSEKLWRACGGDLVTLQGFSWTRILRPLLYARSLVLDRLQGVYGLAARALGPACHALEVLAARTGPGSRWVPACPDAELLEDPSAEMLLGCMQSMGAGHALAPAYDIDTLRWLLARAGEKERHGALRKTVVQDSAGRIAGWYLYYMQRGGLAQVLQLGARRDAAAKVLDCLFHQAWRAGAVAVSGGMEARFVRELAAGRCQFAWPECAVVAHSRHADILNAVHRGDAFLTRLEGEWWARFSDPRWSRREPVPPAPAVKAAGPPLEVNQLSPR